MADFVDYNGNNIEESLLVTHDSPGLMPTNFMYQLEGMHQTTVASGIYSKFVIASVRYKWVYDKTIFHISGILNGAAYFGLVSVNYGEDAYVRDIYLQDQGVKITLDRTIKKNDPYYGGETIILVFNIPQHSVITITGADIFDARQGDYEE